MFDPFWVLNPLIVCSRLFIFDHFMVIIMKIYLKNLQIVLQKQLPQPLPNFSREDL